MQLEHSFTVPVGIDEAWRVLLDVERSGPCLPGAIIDTVSGDEITGSVKVKLGPINLTYVGRTRIVEQDAAARRIVVTGEGTDARNGTAATTITATLRADGEVTVVDVLTDLEFTGKPAQFGRDVMVDVGAKLIGQFGDALAAVLRGDPPAAAITRAAPSRKAATKKTAAKKTAAKKAAAKKAPATKAAVRKTAARKAPTVPTGFTPGEQHPEERPQQFGRYLEKRF